MYGSELYKTSDLQTAAVLMCLGHILEDVVRKNKKFGARARAVFCFRKNSSLEEDVLAYQNDEIALSPRVLLGRIRDLKAQAFAIC